MVWAHTGTPVRWWSHYPWRCSRRGWMSHWVTWVSSMMVMGWRLHCMILMVLPALLILWFFESVFTVWSQLPEGWSIPPWFFFWHLHLLFPICCLRLPLDCKFFGAATVFYSTYSAKLSGVLPHDCRYEGATKLQINTLKSHIFSSPGGSTGFAFPHRILLSSELFLNSKGRTQMKRSLSFYHAALYTKKLRYLEGTVFFVVFLLLFGKSILTGKGESSWQQKANTYKVQIFVNQSSIWNIFCSVHVLYMSLYSHFIETYYLIEVFISCLMFVDKQKTDSLQKLSFFWHFCFPIKSFSKFSVLCFCC